METENHASDGPHAEVQDLHPALLVFSSRMAADAGRKAPQLMLFGMAGVSAALLALPAKNRWLPLLAAAGAGLGVWLAQRR
ncbi:MAG: hypothetical protein ACFCGT_01555 [Sandaracinaceae bacterium]